MEWNENEMEVPNIIQKQQSLKMWVTLREKKKRKKNCKKQSQRKKGKNQQQEHGTRTNEGKKTAHLMASIDY